MTLTVHAKPILSNSCRAIIGNTTPPVTLPHVVTLIASAFFFVKYVDTFASAGVYDIPAPNPPQIPWAKKSCQYSVQRDVMNTARTCRVQPTMSRERKWPASKSRPEKMPMLNRRKACTLPVQEISERARCKFSW